MRVSDILDKGREVITIGPSEPLRAAVAKLVAKKVGALVVVDEAAAVCGILTERDILNECDRSFDRLADKKVSEAMTRDVLVALADDDLDALMEEMTDRRLRHLPVLHDGRMVGIVSIGDIVKAQAHHCAYTVRHLNDYISGKYPG
jgi:CBS domain-containing protein